MKHKFFTLLSAIIVSVSVAVADSNVAVLDSTIRLDANGKPTEKSVHKYSNNGLSKETITYVLDNSMNQWQFSWKYEYKYEYKYDNAGRVLEFKSYSWNIESTDWQISYTEDNEYDNNGNTVLSVYYYWNEAAQTLVGSQKSRYAYDANSNRTLYISYSWDADTHSWKNSYKNEATYNANGKILTDIDYRGVAGTDTWVGSYKREFTYDANDNETLVVIYNWSSEKDDWSKSYKTEFSYDTNNNLLQELEYEWKENDWSCYGKHVYTYDLSNHKVINIHYRAAGTESWTIHVKVESTYNANNLLLSEIHYSYQNEEWVDTEKHVYKYDAAGNKIFEGEYFRDDEASEWERNFENEWAYDANGNQIMTSHIFSSFGDKYEYTFNSNAQQMSSISSYWDYENSRWIPTDKSSYVRGEDDRILLFCGYKYSDSSWNLNFTVYSYYQGEESPEMTANVQSVGSGVKFEWYAVENATGYDIHVWADELHTQEICVIYFDAQGKYVSSEKASMSSRMQIAQEKYEYTLEGLTPNTQYWYQICAHDDVNILNICYGNFVTASTTAINNNSLNPQDTTNKIFRNGQLYIIRDGKMYTTTGAEVK